MKYLIIIIFSLVHSYMLFAQTTFLSGYIIDNTSEEPIPYAHIKLDNTGGSISNIKGEFIISIGKKSSKSDSIQISSIGYYPKTLAIQQLINAPSLKIRLEPKHYTLGDFTVFDKEYPLNEIEVRQPYVPNDSFMIIRTSFMTGKKIAPYLNQI